MTEKNDTENLEFWDYANTNNADKIRQSIEAADDPEAKRKELIEIYRTLGEGLRKPDQGIQYEKLADWINAPIPELIIGLPRANINSKAEPWPWISRTEPGILSAAGGSGKSYVALGFALAMVNGDKRCYGLQIKPGNVLMVSYEDSAARLGNRARGMIEVSGGTPLKKRPHEIEFIRDPGALLKADPSNRGAIYDTGTLDSLREKCEKLNPSLVIFDPASELIESADANQPGPVRELLRELANLPTNPGILIIAHSTKSARDEMRLTGQVGAGQVSGSVAWQDRARGVGLMNYYGDRPVIEITKSNHGRTGWGFEVRPAFDHYANFRGFEFEQVFTPEQLEKEFEDFEMEREAEKKARNELKAEKVKKFKEKLKNQKTDDDDWGGY